MWSQINNSPVPAGHGRSPFAPRPAFALALLCLLLLSGCGYTLATSGTSVLGDGAKTLKVKGVEYPTLHPWLPNAIRSRLRDEVNARYLAKWVDSGSADYEIQINVLSFTSREWIRTELDTAQMYSTSMTIQGIVYDGSTNREVWRSSNLSYSEYEEQSDEKLASQDIITQVVRQLADEMRNTF